MWRFILTASLLCWGSEGTVTCKDNNNGDVDWYMIYKAPELNNESFTGLEYLYIDPTREDIMTPSTPNYKPINDSWGVLANTLQPIFTSNRSMLPNFGFISYSDQPPGRIAESDKLGHGKGVLMVNKTGTGVWLAHSMPHFPYRRNQDDFFPESGKTNAQMFICTTFSYDEFKKIGNYLQLMRAFPFEHDIPEDFHEELRKATDWVKLEPSNNFQTLTTNGGHTFQSIAKQITDKREMKYIKTL